MRSLTPILEEGVFCLRFGTIGADVTEDVFFLTGNKGGLKPLAPQMPCSMPASLSPTPVSRRNSGPVGPRQNHHQQHHHHHQGNLSSHNSSTIVLGANNNDDSDDGGCRPASARLTLQAGGHRRLDRCLSEPTSPGSRSGNGSNGQSQNARNVIGNSSRYKTELCRPFEETGHCKYGEKCQFAHGPQDLRSVQRHRKYKTELCRTYHTIGFCPYGPRCHFIHNAEEARIHMNNNNNNNGKQVGHQRPLTMSMSMTMPLPSSSSSLSTTPSPTHSDSMSLSGSPTSTMFWLPGDDDCLDAFHHHHGVPQHHDMDFYRVAASAAKPTFVEFPEYNVVGRHLGHEHQTMVDDGLGNGAAGFGGPRLPVFSRLAGADSNDGADR